MSRLRQQATGPHGRPVAGWEPAPELEAPVALFVPANPPGPIERRKATPDELAAGQARDARLNGRGGLAYTPTDEERRRASHNGVARRLGRPTLPSPSRPPSPAPVEVPVMPEAPTLELSSNGYTRLAAAAMEAADAHQAKLTTDERWERARAELEAAWADTQGHQMPLLEPTGSPTNIPKIIPGPVDEPVPAVPASPGRRDAELLDAMREAGKVTGAARIMGVSDSRVRQLLRRLEARGALPDDVAAMVRRKVLS